MATARYGWRPCWRAVTLLDYALAIFGRPRAGRHRGVELALALGVMVVFGAGTFPEAITAAACFAWLIRDGRTGPARAG